MNRVPKEFDDKNTIDHENEIDNYTLNYRKDMLIIENNIENKKEN